jgi:hypothetical protein
MTSKRQQTATANKIKKWLEVAKQLHLDPPIFAIPITRLTSIKSLCQEREAAQQFAVDIAQKVKTQMNETERPERIPPEEWESHQTVMNKAVSQMEAYVETPTPEGKQMLRAILTEINGLQGDNYRRVHWTTVHFVRSGDLLKLEYALQCFTKSDYPYWAYKLGREYAEEYKPSAGSGLIPESLPALLDIAEFWCQYYFDQTLEEKFPQFTEALTANREGVEEHD